MRQDFAGCRVLVTGSSGFLGSHVCARLLRDGAVVYAASRRRVPPDPQLPKPNGVRRIRTDLDSVEAVRRLLAVTRPEVILHFSGHVTAATDVAVVRPIFDSLLRSTVNILAAAAEVGSCRRIVIPGSLTEPAPGQTEAPPSSPYAAAKWASSAYARMFYALYATPVVIVRAAMTYGPAQPRERLLPYVILSALAGQQPRLSSGHLQADWTYVDDIVEAILAAARVDGIDGLTIDLGTGQSISARSVVELALELMGTPLRPEFGALPDRPLECVRAADVTTARERLGWTATTPLRDGLRQTIAWFASHGGFSVRGSLRDA
jgi:UDP-glucose 4-epimerase